MSKLFLFAPPNNAEKFLPSSSKVLPLRFSTNASSGKRIEKISAFVFSIVVSIAGDSLNIGRVVNLVAGKLYNLLE